ncbi:hypothetical protein [Brevibacillus sp. BC25]|uniref:hypothetical protein n=1 Tax=Brevibacillus sp. BC25 TaxID=1144308 RepID=UPI000271402E|nr:hypothetical protein [Brevibacillus sp. BC25]EJL22979.1 hypothetical protein PMI05_04765 [Brevibacillus sp. BC25]
MVEVKTAKVAKKPGFFKELLTFLLVVAIIFGIASGAIFYLSGKNLDDGVFAIGLVPKNSGLFALTKWIWELRDW